MTHHHLVCDDVINLLNENINTKKKNKWSVLSASKDVDLEVNARITRHHAEGREETLT
jgi:hypothetical protein